MALAERRTRPIPISRSNSGNHVGDVSDLNKSTMARRKYRGFPVAILLFATVFVLAFIRRRPSSLGLSYSVEVKDGSSGTSASHDINVDLPWHYGYPPGKKRDGSPCWRGCPKVRTNKIVYLHFKPDGLSDRQCIFTRLINLAGYICATLVVPKPFEMLSTWHNYNNHSQNNQHDNNPDRDHQWDNGFPISPHLQWIDFFNFTFQQDHSSSMEELPVPMRGQALQHYMMHSDYRNYTKFVTEKPRDMIRHWREAELYSWQQQEASSGTSYDGLIWIIDIDWFIMDVIFERKIRSPTSAEKSSGTSGGKGTTNTPDSATSKAREKMLPYPATAASPDIACNYLQPNSIPTAMQRLIDRIWVDVLESGSQTSTTTSRSGTAPIVGMLHIRRTDGRSECDTSIERMKSYISCSFQTSPFLLDATNSLQSRDNSALSVIVLFATDEKDSEYRQSIVSVLQEQSKLVLGTNAAVLVHVVDLDALVTRHVQEAINVTGDLAPWFAKNNYYVYRIEQILRTDYASFILQQRRSMQCHDCDPIQITPTVRDCSRGSRQTFQSCDC
jgi:hypothetical protein